ncbi:MAG: uracil-DNA glycosylase [Bacteroidetes bacterium]|nr:uracil-DNA glycosylase [Bacteroidota bacterium]MBL7136787.1 uracil-DNA glycosylase [Candidatus Neomarinimicrobiota bacterium]
MIWFFKNGKLDEKWVNDYCFGDWKKCVRYEMEEDGKYHPDNMLPDEKIDERLQY